MPHAHYFVGLIASQLQQYDKAIAAFTKALEIDPFLVSAEFGLARAYQRSGKPDDAKTHMDRFTRMTQSKVASAMSLAYGDQGPLSLAAAVQPPPAATDRDSRELRRGRPFASGLIERTVPARRVRRLRQRRA